MHPFLFDCYLKPPSFFSPPYFSSDKSTHQNQFPFPTSTPMSSSAVLNGLQADHRPDPATLFSGSCLISRPNLGGFSFVARWNNYLVSCLLACLGCSTAVPRTSCQTGLGRHAIDCPSGETSGQVLEFRRRRRTKVQKLISCVPSVCVCGVAAVFGRQTASRWWRRRRQ